jgi:hypothetical protein
MLAFVYAPPQLMRVFCGREGALVKRAGLLMSLIGLVGSGGSYGAGKPLGLPDEFVSYRAWPLLLKTPHQVPLELAIRCAAPKPADWAEAMKKHGPHTQRYVRVFANPVAAAALRAGGPLPVGSVIAKDKLVDPQDDTPEGVGLMVKRPDARLGATGGWEFLYFPAVGDRRETHEHCAACHRAATMTDYVFGSYPEH